MAFLPSGLETLAYNQAGWNAIINTDLDIIDQRGIYKDTAGDVILKGLNTVAKADGGLSELDLNVYIDTATSRIYFKAKKTGGSIITGYVPISAAIVLSSPGYLYKLNLLWVSTSQIQITPGICVDSTNLENIEVGSAITVDKMVSGAGGLDTGSWAVNTLYHAYLIKDVATPAVSSLFSLSATSPTLPSGYTVFRRLGAVKSDLAGNIMQFVHEGATATKTMRYLDTSYTNILTSGAALVWTDIVTAAFVPSISNLVNILVDSSPTTYLRKKGDAVTYSYRIANGDTAATMLKLGVDATGAFQYYKSGSGDINIDLISYEEDL